MISFLRNLVYEQYFLSVPEPTASWSHKCAIVTGANTGLGKEAARYISQLGCPQLILAVRNVRAGEEAKADILATTKAPASTIAVWEVDLGSFASVRRFAERAAGELDRLDALICNAGVNAFAFTEVEGYESMLTVNVLSTTLMATLMLPLLERTAARGPMADDPQPRPPHLCIVSSDTHLVAGFPERNEPAANLLAAITDGCRSSASRLRVQYPTSKLLEVLLVRDMVYRQRSSGPSTGKHAVADPEKIYPVIINAPNPGLCYSSLARDAPGFFTAALNFVFRARPTTMGASALVNAATAGWESNGQFLSSNNVHHGSALTWDFALAEKVWKAVEGSLKADVSANQ